MRAITPPPSHQHPPAPRDPWLRPGERTLYFASQRPPQLASKVGAYRRFDNARPQNGYFTALVYAYVAQQVAVNGIQAGGREGGRHQEGDRD